MTNALTGQDPGGTPTRELTTRVVEALVREGLLREQDRERGLETVARSLAPPTPAAPARGGISQLVEVVAYLGGALVLAAGTLFLVQEWSSLGFGARVGLLAVVTVVLALAGLVAARAPGEQVGDPGSAVRRRLAGTLLTGSALAAAFLAGHLVDHLVHPDPTRVDWPTVVGAGVGALVAAAFYRVVATAVGLVGILVGVLSLLGNVSGALPVGFPGSDGDQVGVAFFVAGVLWLLLTERGAFAERQVARGLGVATALLGAQIPALDGTHAWLGYALTVVVVVVGIPVYLRSHSWPYLAAAVLAVTLVVPEAVSNWTEGSLGAVGGVLVAGVTLLLASFAGYRIRSETVDA